MSSASQELVKASGRFVSRRRPTGLAGRLRTVGLAIVLAGALSAMPATAAAASWSLQKTANPSGAHSSSLVGVSCPQPWACTAVGSSTNGAGATVTLAERWNGVSWSLQATANPSGAHSSSLSGVACPQPRACTAVGSSTDGAGRTAALVERWNGVKWSIQNTPAPAGSTYSSLAGISCTPAGRCTAVGSFLVALGTMTLAEQSTGGEWAIQAIPTPQGPSGPFGSLYGVSCTSASSCLAVGDQYRTMFSERWNGTKWAFAPLSSLPGGIDGAHFPAVSCTGSHACTAAGYYDTGGGAHGLTLAERWNGSVWQQQSAVNPNAAIGTLNIFDGVSCVSSTRCTAVGSLASSSGREVTLAELWGGSSWSVQQTPNPAGSTQSSLAAVSCTASGACAAVGSAAGATLAERYS